MRDDTGKKRLGHNGQQQVVKERAYLFPSVPDKDWIRGGKWIELELGNRGELLGARSQWRQPRSPYLLEKRLTDFNIVRAFSARSGCFSHFHQRGFNTALPACPRMDRLTST